MSLTEVIQILENMEAVRRGLNESNEVLSNLLLREAEALRIAIARLKP